MASIGRRTGRALAIAPMALGLMAATAAGAGTADITGDEGVQVPLVAGADTAVRTMRPTVRVASSGPFSATITTADGTELAGVSCGQANFVRNLFPPYSGNGPYAVTLTRWTDNRCNTPAAGPTVFQYSIRAGVGVARPRGLVLTRAPGNVSPRRVAIPIAPNPNSTTEIAYARNARLAADGSIRGATRSAFVNTARGTADFTFPVPGVYTIVARARSASDTSPWSAPVRVRTVAPFDIRRTVFLDSRGPSYQVRAFARESLARGGVVRIAIAPGRRGGTFRAIGSARVAANGTITHRFTQGRPGVYRLRYTYLGNPLVLRGQSLQGIQIIRRAVLR